MVIWLMGLSGSGKTTLGKALQIVLNSRGIPNCLLDGDAIREGINADLGFTMPDRIENVRRIAQMAKLILENGVIPIVAVITPIEDQRIVIRNILHEKLYLIYLECPLTICIQRDPKGLYRQAMIGNIKEFTGISSPFAPPSTQELTINSSESNVTECLNVLIEFFAPMLANR